MAMLLFQTSLRLKSAALHVYIINLGADECSSLLRSAAVVEFVTGLS